VPITGQQLIDGALVAAGGETFQPHQPRDGRPLEPAVHEATAGEVAAAAAAAAEAAPMLRRCSPDQLAGLLEGIAEELEADGDAIVARADEESGLGAPRLPGELARTTGQLRLFARVLADGHHLDAVIDHADPGATPPKPDLRRANVPVGPVAVFGASNFPLAFGVAGGDTASALASGCPVVAKAHPANAGTSELVAAAIVRAVAGAGLPAGTFSLLQGEGVDVGRELVLAPEIAAVGFTGSLRGGRALHDLAATRPEPIPVYAEMGSINPVWVTRAAAEARTEAIAEGLAGSFTMGSGQFCTKPGVAFIPAGDAGERLIDGLREQVAESVVGPLLASRIADAFRDGGDRLAAVAGVEVVARGPEPQAEGWRARPTVLRCDVATWRDNDVLGEECFGPALLVVTGEAEELRTAAAGLEGNLTATIHSEPGDEHAVAELVEVLSDRVGRIIHNGYPTGVAVTWAQHHGGPYPATTAPRDTSVGTGAIRRFLRPVAHQDADQAVLPAALRDDNPWGLPRRVDGVMRLDG
jgi:NADP-dependent aldehyde dehydrogenase